MEKNTTFFKTALAVMFSLLSASTGLQFWNNYKQEDFEKTVNEQLKGKLSADATEIATLNTKLKNAISKMITHEEMQKRTDAILKRIGDSSESLQKHLDKTDAKIYSYSERVSNIETKLNGVSKVIIKNKRGEKIKVEPPKEDWEGVKPENFLTCFYHYDKKKCPRINYNWESSHKNKGNTVAKFDTQNLWLREEGDIKLNLAFKVNVVTYGEDQTKLGSGAIKNQAVFIQAGYIENGEFFALAEDTLEKGNPNLDPKFFSTPPKTTKTKSYGRFEPSYFVGVSSLPMENLDIGLIGGGTFVNFFDATLRLGGEIYISNENFGLGPHISYHYSFAGKFLNVAPSFSYLFSTEKNLFSFGLSFQIW